MKDLLARLCLSAVLIALSQESVRAQCPTPDGLDNGPCCAQAQLFLPRLPNFTGDALSICWQNCSIDAVQACNVVWTTPLAGTVPGVVPACGPQYSRVTLFDTSGLVKWRGQIALTYSRTWYEVDNAGLSYQVWRFLANGDMTPTAAAGPMPCPVPPCAPAHGNRVRYTGFVDFAEQCGSFTFQHAWMLTHACDFFDHAPGFPRSGVFHPDRSYTFVGPGSTFAPGSLQPIEGGAGPFDAVRHVAFNAAVPPSFASCVHEEVSNHSFAPLGQQCFCSSGPSVPQHNLLNLTVNGSCGTSLTTPGAPYLPGFVSMGLGSWTSPTSYPGQEVLRWNTGGYDRIDTCTGVVLQEVYYGVTTIGGFTPFDIIFSGVGPPLPPTFIDQGNSLRNAAFTVRNMPYVSDFVLNLNE